MFRVDLGCGNHKKPGFYGIDMYPGVGVDLVADLENGIPLDTGSVDELYSSHFLEHIHNLHRMICEIYRVCKDGAVVEIYVPHYTLHPYEFHVRYGFRYRMLSDYEVGNRDKMLGMGDFFICRRRELVFTGVYRFVSRLMNSFPEFYEGSFLKCLFPCSEVHVIEVVVKH